MKICSLSVVIFLFICQSTIGQQKEFIFKNFTQEEGLPSNETYYIFEDSRHYLWIATDLGVVRYNGSKFEIFNLPDNVIFKIKEDSKGRIWFFTHKAQLAYFEDERIHLYKYNENIARRIGRINIVDAYVDDRENIFLSQSSDSNYIISPSGDIWSNYNKTDSAAPKEFIITFMKNNLLFTENSAGGTAMSNKFLVNIKRNNKSLSYSIPTKNFPFHHYGSVTADGKNIYFFGGKTIIKLLEDGSFKSLTLSDEILCLSIKENKLWAGMMKKGAICINTNLVTLLSDTTLKNKSITSIAYDYEGGLYFSTLENGVYYQKNNNIKVLVSSTLETNKSISRLMNFKDSAIVYANSSGLFFLKGKKAEQILGIANSTINDLFMDNKKNLYCFGGFFNLRSEIKKSRTKFFEFFYLLNSPSEPVKLREDSFISSLTYGVNLYKSSFINSYTQNSISDSGYTYNAKILINKQLKLFKDINDNIWGGGNDGLYISNSLKDTMLRFKSSSQLLTKGISCIRQMDNGILVTGIRFGGIAMIKDTNIIANITEKDGLLSNKIRYILPLKNNLWVATAKGISVIRFTSYNPLRFSIINIGKNDGFYNITINQLMQFQENIVAATSNGIYFIETPEEILNRKLPAIPFYINNINYYKGDTSGINNISIPYSKNRVLLKYNAVCFNSPEEVKYVYRFQKTDTSWHSTSNNELLLENLEPGLYNLQIKAVIPSQNRSSALLSFMITVEKPWWQNNWLRLLIILSVSGCIYLYVSDRIKKIRHKEKMKSDLNAKITELEQTALRSQMNPHFIFNCLTSIQQLIVTGNKTDANEYLVKFARLIRKTLDLSSSSFISIREEIEYLNEYISLEQLRLSGLFNYNIAAEKDIDTDKIRIPNMMIQPVVENCIRHGIKSLENKKGLIEIRFGQDENKITCTVTDNGVGRDNSAMFNKNAFTTHKSYGIDIIEKRLKTFSEFNQTDMGIEVKDLYSSDGSPAGTQVIMQLPFKMNL